MLGRNRVVRLRKLTDAAFDILVTDELVRLKRTFIHGAMKARNVRKAARKNSQNPIPCELPACLTQAAAFVRWVFLRGRFCRWKLSCRQISDD